ncbi:MAG: NADPH-dependent FMN reductase [Rhizobiales bacterium]|nr:NADPH-dependent FMN reductase [Hyphomicrobiales bacterium]
MRAIPPPTPANTLNVVAVSGSPSADSSTALLAEHVLARLPAAVGNRLHVRIRELDPLAVLSGNAAEPRIAAAVAAIDRADGVIFATPVFKAAYSGLLKAFLDLLPQFGLAGKAILPVATGGSLAHVLALDYALRPVLQSMGARHIVQSHFVAGPQMHRTTSGIELTPEAEAPLREAIFHFGLSVQDYRHAPLLGHPRPARVA